MRLFPSLIRIADLLQRDIKGIKTETIRATA